MIKRKLIFMTKKNFFILVLFLQSWIFFSVLLTAPIQSENVAPQENHFSVKTSSNVVFERLLNETQVNYHTPDSQERPSICALSNDTFAVAWQSYGQDATDTWGVYASVFNATTGNNITREFRVNNYTTNDQVVPSICALSNDTFAVAWQSYGQDATDTWGVYASVFNATTGNETIPEFRVNDYTVNNQKFPAICALSNDTFAVAWESYAQGGPLEEIYAKVINATTGNSITSEIHVNNHNSGHQANPSICALSSDTFAVAWQCWHLDGDDFGVFARVINATTGDYKTSDIQINDHTVGAQFQSSICALSNDTFAVAWQSNLQDGSFYGVYARVINATTGNNITREFRVNDYTDDSQLSPSICALSSDILAIAWTSWGQDGSGYGVYARLFDATTGNYITNEFQVNHYTDLDQKYHSICALSNDTFAVVWSSNGQDSGTTGVYVSVFGNPSTSLPSGTSAAAAAGADDDDDDEEGLAIGIIVLIIVLASVGAGAVVITVLIKKGILDLSKLKRKSV